MSREDATEFPDLSPHVARLVELIDADPRPDSTIAAAAGMARQRLYQIKTGARRDPGGEALRAILDALGKRWADLDEPRRRRP